MSGAWGFLRGGDALVSRRCYPEEVIEATALYRAESDLVGRFIEDQCVTHESCTIKARPFFQTFTKWCQDCGETGMTETRFCKRLTEKGFEKRRDEFGTKYLRLGLRSTREEGEG